MNTYTAAGALFIYMSNFGENDSDTSDGEFIGKIEKENHMFVLS